MAANEIDVRKPLHERTVLEGLPTMQSLPPHIMYHPSMYFGEQELRRSTSNKPASQWRWKSQARLNMCDVASLLAADCEADGNFPEASGIPHNYTGKEVLDGHPIGAREVVV